MNQHRNTKTEGPNKTLLDGLTQPAATFHQTAKGRNLDVRLVYCLNRYPALTEPYQLQEVQGLRECGLSIETAALEKPEAQSLLHSFTERTEQARTFYVAAANFANRVQAHFTLLSRHPLTYLRGLWHAWQLAQRPVYRGARAWQLFQQALLLRAWLAQNQLTHLHVHYDTSPTALVSLLVARLYQLKLSLTVNALPDAAPAAPWLAELLTRAHFVLCADHFTRSQLIQRLPPTEWPKFALMPQAILPNQFQPVEPDAPTQLFEVLHVGPLEANEGQLILLEALAQLRRKGQQLRVRLVGTGSARATLENYVAEHDLRPFVTFEGAVSLERRAKLYAQAAAFVHTSLTWQTPRPLLEAMFMQLPCIAAQVAGIPELICHGLDGLLVAPAHADALAEALALLLEEPTLRGELGLAAHDRIVTQHNFNETLPRLAAFHYRQLHGLELTNESATYLLAAVNS